jgi:hypothetical protein
MYKVVMTFFDIASACLSLPQLVLVCLSQASQHTDKKENKIFLITKFRWDRLQSHDSLIYEEMRKQLVIYEEAVCHILICNQSLRNFPMYEENFLFLFYQYMPQIVLASINLLS